MNRPVAARESVGGLLEEGRRGLLATPFGAATREALLLLGRVLGQSEAQLLAHPELAVPPAAAAAFRRLLARRLRGEPVAYLVGEKEFYGRRFAVDERVLIPRPETEHLVEAALALALPPGPRILDVGTGSGCLAVTLALELPGSWVVASDLSPAALAVAAANARRLGAAEQVAPVAADLLAGIDPGRFDLLVCNPPYVDRRDAPALSPEVCAFEPHLALFSPGAGDSTLAHLFAQCGRGLRTGVPLVVEIGYGQLEAVRRHAAAAALELIETREDYSSIPRVAVLRRSPGTRP
ncbi:MAG TPA: peptide chain release factor N(5)-glutamine methyltransferase [Thermoanaerobaculia bacterium]|nr:peptide chain release factor N(5)-glutamine methyltransferase [Thermoanaerobaculia bacterium]